MVGSGQLMTQGAVLEGGRAAGIYWPVLPERPGARLSTLRLATPRSSSGKKLHLRQGLVQFLTMRVSPEAISALGVTWE
jgi:hypothetical protein